MKPTYPILFLLIIFSHFLSAQKTNEVFSGCGTDQLLHNDEKLLGDQKKLDLDAYTYISTRVKSQHKSLTTYTIPVVVHIVHQGGSENISDAQVQTAIANFNTIYSKNSGEQIQFCLAQTDPNGNPTTGITRNFSSLTTETMEVHDIALKDLNRWPPTCYLNIWIVKEILSLSSGSGVAGYAYFPSAHGLNMDGLVIEAQYFGVSLQYDAIGAHEVGHYFGLYHTFEGGCSNFNCLQEGDNVCDTPPDQTTFASCIPPTNSCSTDADDTGIYNPYTADVSDNSENYMDYATISCYLNFTGEQYFRMNYFLANVRSSLLNCNSCASSCPAPVTANITTPSTSTNITTTSSVNFVGTVSNSSSYQWYINTNTILGTALSVSYTFNTPGLYWMKFKAITANPSSCSNDIDSILINVQDILTPPSTDSIIAPDTICVNQSFTVTNTNTASTYYWNFCSGNVNTTPVATNLGNPGGLLQLPVFTQIYKDAGNYYMFVTNNQPGTPSSLVRLHFGSSLSSMPTTVNLGNPNNALPDGYLQDLKIVNENGHYYGIVTGGWANGGNGTTTASPRMVRLDFGNSLMNTPTAATLGNIGSWNYPQNLEIFQSGGNYYGFVLDVNGNTVSRLDFGNSISNTPTHTTLPNISSLNYPAGLSIINYQNNWYGYIVNLGIVGTNSITVLNFGNSLTNIPTEVTVNTSTTINTPCAISVIPDCGGLSGIIGTYQQDHLITLNFPNGPVGTIVTTDLGNIANVNHPVSFNRYRVADTLFTFVPNAGNNTISRLEFLSCTNSSIPSSTLQNPPPISFNSPGIYEITLTTDETLITESTICKQVVVIDCNCPILTISNDTTICTGASVILTTTGASTYSWLPSTGLNAITGAVVIATPTVTTTYTVIGTTLGPELVFNNDFSLGNVGFINDYTYMQLGYTAGTYFVGNDLYTNNPNPQWSGHTNPVSDMYSTFQYANVVSTLWEQTVNNLQQNVNYTFSFWSSRGAAGPQYKRGHYEVHFIGDVTGDVVVSDFLAIQTVQSTWFWDESPSVIWNSQGNNTVTIRIKNVETNGDGNQYGIDDISLKLICKDTAITTVTVNDSNTGGILQLGNDISLCLSGTHTFDAGAGFKEYTWQDGSTNQTFTAFGVGKYWVTVKNFCSSFVQSDTALITLAPTPSLELGNDTIFCSGESIQLNYSSTGTFSTFQWSPASGLSCTNCANPVARPLATTKYYLSASTSKGCTNMDSISINIKKAVNPDSDIQTANIFSPNNDGINDVFKITTAEIFNCKIYNRWGLLMFESANPNSSWNGKNLKGVDCTDGVYYYLITAKDECGKEFDLKGFIELIR